jgi:hypothetical protein
VRFENRLRKEDLFRQSARVYTFPREEEPQSRGTRRNSRQQRSEFVTDVEILHNIYSKKNWPYVAGSVLASSNYYSQKNPFCFAGKKENP